MTTLGPINNNEFTNPLTPNKSSTTDAKNAKPVLVSHVEKEQVIDLGKLFAKLTPEELKDYIEVLSKKTGLNPKVMKELLIEESGRYIRDQETLPFFKAGSSDADKIFEQFRDRETLLIPPQPANKNDDPLQSTISKFEDEKNANLLNPSTKEKQKQANLEKLYNTTKAFINSKDEPNKTLQNKVKTASAISLNA